MGVKNFILIILSLFVISCGGGNGDNPRQDGNRRFETSDPQFDGYKIDFINEAAVFGLNLDLGEIPINFGDLDNIESRTTLHHAHNNSENCDKDHGHFAYRVNNAGDTQTVGVCIEYSNGLKEILLRESSWQNLSDLSREILVFHELGHCDDALDRDHIDATYRGYDLSIMNSLLINPTDYVRYYDEYQEELFTFDSQPLRDAIDNDLIP